MGGEWKETTLAEVMEVKHGYAFSGVNIRDVPSGDILLTPGNFAVGGGFKGDKFKYFDGEVPEDYVLKEDELVITMTDLSKQADTLGYPALVPKPSGHRFLHNQRLGKVLIKRGAELDKGFLYYLLRSDEYRHEILASATGTTVKHTSPGRILAHKASIPPLPTQKAIAHILGTLDDKIALNRRMNATLEEMARAIFKSWFIDFDPVIDNALRAGNPIPDEFAERAVLRKSRSSAPPLPNFGNLFPNAFRDSELGPIPAGWEVATLDVIANVSSGKRPVGRNDTLSSECNIPLYGGGGKMGYVPCPLYENPILFTGRVGTLGLIFRTSEPSWPSDNTIIVEPQDGLFDFTYFVLKGFDLMTLNRGSTQPLLTQTDLKNQHFVLPPSGIVKEYEKFAAPIFQQIATSENQTRTLAALRDTLLPKLLSGELSVADGSYSKSSNSSKPTERNP